MKENNIEVLVNTSFDFFKDKKIVITGHTGFKGSWLSIWLHMLGAEIYGISDQIPTDPSLFETLELDKKMTHILLDVRDSKSIKKHIKSIQPDFVFHLAAQPIVSTSYSDPLDTISTNVMGTAIVLEALKLVNKKCVGVFITSDKCYENVEWEWGYKETDKLGGKDIYSGSKAAAEIIFSSYFHSFISKMPNIRIATGRAGNVIGGGDWAKDRIVPDCIKSWTEGNPVEIRKPYSTRPWQHVLEPLSGYMQLAIELWKSDKHNGDSFNFGPPTDNNITVLNLLKNLSEKFGINDPESAFIYNKEETFAESGLLNLNCEKAEFHFKWKPTLKLSELISFTGDWYWKNFKNKGEIIEFTSFQISEFTKIAQNKKIKWAKKNSLKSIKSI